MKAGETHEFVAKENSVTVGAHGCVGDLVQQGRQCGSSTENADRVVVDESCRMCSRPSPCEFDSRHIEIFRVADEFREFLCFFCIEFTCTDESVGQVLTGIGERLFVCTAREFRRESTRSLDEVVQFVCHSSPRTPLVNDRPPVEKPRPAAWPLA